MLSAGSDLIGRGMERNRAGNPRAPSRWGTGVIFGIAFLLIAAVMGWNWLLGHYDGRRNIDLERWATAEDPWTQSLMPDARWATEELCTDELPCIQAVTSRTLTLYRFAERDEAVAAAESFGEHGYLTGWIAVRYEPDGLTARERDDFGSGIGCINTWVSEDGRDC